jgi:hypothetical protein
MPEENYQRLPAINEDFLRSNTDGFLRVLED